MPSSFIASIEATIAATDKKLSEQINQSLHHDDRQQPAGAWPGPHYMVTTTDTPAATPEELRSAWEAATDAVEKSFEADVDSASNAVGFLREGHDRCVPVRAGIVTDR